MKVLLRCSFELEVEVPDDCHNVHFMIEENSCPGTGLVGAKLQEVMEQHEEIGTCWACALQGENQILQIDGRLV